MKKKVSYIKTHWFNLLVALFCFAMTCVYAFKPAPDTTTIEGIDTLITNTVNAVTYFFGFMLWSFGSIIDHLADRLKLLEDKIESLEEKK